LLDRLKVRREVFAVPTHPFQHLHRLRSGESTMRHPSVRPALLVGSLVLAAGCASGGSSAGTTASSPTPAPSASASPAPARHDRTRLTPDEIATAHETNMYDVISKLRPQWLQSRGVASRDATATQIQVYLDGVKQDGGLTSLRQIEPGRVTMAQRIDGADATTRFGMDNSGGAILLATR
jgi:hypothetical protein